MTPSGASASAIRSQNGTRIPDKGEHPATPGAIGDTIRKLTGVEIGLVRGDVVDAALATRRLERAKESFGLVDGHHAPGRGDQLGKIQRSVAGPASDIQHRVTSADPGRPPGVKRTLPPRAVLQAEALDLLIVRAQHVIFRRTHFSPSRAVPGVSA
jgi:hypothetical protein